ncbi:MAG TPA: DUF1287 domain-containing protein [Bacillota bacterium]|jgi:uncharacterized protein YijF (DUF1287 family)|nr:DUF1287 domain-containing protein [Bacillota bacterium]
MEGRPAKPILWLLLPAAALILLAAAALLRLEPFFPPGAAPGFKEPSPVEKIPPAERTVYDLILLGARKEVEKGTRYDASYQAISYPGGDVDPSVGACTDVVIRALRAAGFDLQELIHEDMRRNFELYPQLWGLDGPDPNIDHRRTQNQMFFFERFGEKLTLEVTEATLDQWRHGDIVYWRFPGGEQHTGIISDRTNARGIPLVIHNIGIAREEDCLLRWEIIGHYRFPKEE